MHWQGWMQARRRSRLVAMTCAAALLGGACSPDGPTDTAPDDGAASASAPTDDEGTSPETSEAASEAALADAVFLTAVDDVVAGTVYEGLVDAAPGEFLRTATLVCERLAAGQERADVLELYLEALGAGDPSQEDARLAGALVGAAVETYCPRQAS